MFSVHAQTRACEPWLLIGCTPSQSLNIASLCDAESLNSGTPICFAVYSVVSTCLGEPPLLLGTCFNLRFADILDKMQFL